MQGGVTSRGSPSHFGIKTSWAFQDSAVIALFSKQGKRRPREAKRLAKVTQLVTTKVQTKNPASFPLCCMPASDCGRRRLLDAFQGEVVRNRKFRKFRNIPPLSYTSRILPGT